MADASDKQQLCTGHTAGLAMPGFNVCMAATERRIKSLEAAGQVDTPIYQALKRVMAIAERRRGRLASTVKPEVD